MSGKGPKLFCKLFISTPIVDSRHTIQPNYDRMTDGPPHLRATYNDIHKLIGETAKRIAVFKPNLFIAIGHPEFHPSLRTCADRRSYRWRVSCLSP